jgi:hypothetical protein
MTQADRVHSTPPTNTPISQGATSRRRFLSQAAGVAAGGTVLALAAIPPASAMAAPATSLDPANASPALRAAALALDDAGDRLKEARASSRIDAHARAIARRDYVGEPISSHLSCVCRSFRRVQRDGRL